MTAMRNGSKSQDSLININSCMSQPYLHSIFFLTTDVICRVLNAEVKAVLVGFLFVLLAFPAFLVLIERAHLSSVHI